MAWNPALPATNAPLLSAPVRENFQALDTAVMAALSALFTGQVLYKDAGPVLAGVAPGTSGQFLQLSGALPVWGTPPGFPNPMTTLGDLLGGGGSGVPVRLAVGTESQVLTVSGGIPTWQPRVGFANPMTTVGDLIRGGAAGDPTRLAPGTNGHFLTLAGGVPTWSALPIDPGFANPMTAAGDVIVGGVAGAPQRLAKGADTQVLTLVAGTPAWAAPAGGGGGMTNPMTTPGDLIVGSTAGAPSRLGVGANTQVLTVVGGALTWQAPTSGGMTNPMTAVGDVIIGGTAGAANRLAAGTNGFVLTMTSGSPAWAAPTGGGGGMTNPMTTLGDVIVADSGGTPIRLAIGTTGHVLTVVGGTAAWAANAALANPMTAVGDVIRGGASGAATRLAIGGEGQVLTVVSGTPAWTAAAFANPMTTPEDLIKGGVAGAAVRFPIGTNGQVLTVVGGAMAWTSGGVSFPLLAPDGAYTGPSYSFAGNPLVGLWANGPHVALSSDASGSFYFMAGSTVRWSMEPTRLVPGGDSVYDIGSSAARVLQLWANATVFSATTAPATPAAGHVVTYAKTDKKMYAKDDAGVETALGGGGGAGANVVRLPIEQATLPDGSAGNVPPEFVREKSTGTLTNAPSPTRTYAKFDGTADEVLSWGFILPSNWVSGGTLRVKWKPASGSGNVIWKAGAAPLTDGSTNDNAVAFTAVNLSAASAAGGTGQVSEATIALTTTGFGVNRWVSIFLGRDADNALDTLNAIDAILMGVMFEYTA